MEASVAEIHAYPVRPEGFEEPLFPTRESRRAVAEHLLGASWLCRASELVGRGEGRTVHARREPVEVGGRGGCLWVARGPGRRTGGRARRRRRVVGLLDRWREVGRWWDEDARVDRLVLRVLLSNGAVVDLVREGPGGEGRGGWFLVGVED